MKANRSRSAAARVKGRFTERAFGFLFKPGRYRPGLQPSFSSSVRNLAARFPSQRINGGKARLSAGEQRVDFVSSQRSRTFPRRPMRA